MESGIIQGEETQSTIYQNSIIEKELIEKIYSNDEEQQLTATQNLRKIFSREQGVFVEEVILKRIVLRLVTFLKNNSNVSLQYQAAWVLTNIASGTPQQTKIVIKAGAVPIFIELLSNPIDYIQDQAVWALGNIAADSRDYLLNSGVLPPLLQILSKKERLTKTRNAIWTLCNLCRGKNPPVDFAKIVKALPILARMLNHTDPKVLSDTCLAISYLSDGPKFNIQAVINAGVCRRLVELLMHPQDSVVTAALRAIGNIVTGDDVQTQVILNLNALTHIGDLLNAQLETIRKTACWTISNITAGGKKQIQAVIDADIFPKLLNVLQTGDLKTKKEAAWAIINAISSDNTEAQVSYMVDIGCIPYVCEFLTLTDLEIIKVSLGSLENILKAGKKFSSELNPYALAIKECGGLRKIENLQWHHDVGIYNKSFYIIENYFGKDEYDSREVLSLS